eukprot:GFYU01011536.1.p1 GENE.GFYU01011536.1~~GFYU01011536.1.p1  ORF type:complete len:568 (-),score=-5.14 GFYU01011536.1:207-1889(-)
MSASSNNDVLGQSVYAFQLTSAAAQSPSPDHLTDDATSPFHQAFSSQDHHSNSQQSSPLRTDVPSTAVNHDGHNHSALPHMHSEDSSTTCMTPAHSNVTAPPTTTNTPMAPKPRPARVTRQFHTVPLNTVDLTYSIAAINDAVNSKPTSSKFNPSRRCSATLGSGFNSTVGSATATSCNNNDATNNSCNATANGGVNGGCPSLHERVQAFHELHQREGYLQPYHWDGEKLTLAKKPPSTTTTTDPSAASMTHLPVSLLLEELRPYFDPRNNETYPIVTHHQILLVVPDEAVTAQVSHYAKKVNAMSSTTTTIDASQQQQQQRAENFPFNQGDDDALGTPLVVERHPAPPLLTLSPSAINVSAINTPTAPSPQSTTSGGGGGASGGVGGRAGGRLPGRTQSMASLLSGASTDTTWRQHGCRPRIARLLTRSATRVPRCPSLFLYAAPPGTVAVYPAQPQGNIPIGPTVIVANRRVENPEAPAVPTSSHHSKTASSEEANSNTTHHSKKVGSNIIAPKVVQVDYFPYDRDTQEAGSGASYYTSGVSSAAALRRRLQQEKQAL